LTFDLGNIFNSAHSHDKYLEKGKRDIPTGVNGQTTKEQTAGKHHAFVEFDWQRMYKKYIMTCENSCQTVIKGVFDFTESRFSFTVNPKFDSMANRTVWIRGCCRKWRHFYLFTFVISLFCWCLL